MIKTIWRLPGCAHGQCNTCPANTHYTYLDGTDYWAWCACPCHGVVYPSDYKYDFTDQVIRSEVDWCPKCHQVEVKTSFPCSQCIDNLVEKITKRIFVDKKEQELQKERDRIRKQILKPNPVKKHIA